MESSSTIDPLTRLEHFLSSIHSLTNEATDADFAKVASFMTMDCSTNFFSMRELPVIGRETLVAQLREYLKVWHLDDYRFLRRALSNDGKLLFVEMENQLRVCGDIVAHEETCVASFTDHGLIDNLKFHGCRSAIVAVIQAKTGRGPYVDGAKERDFFGDRIRCCD